MVLIQPEPSFHYLEGHCVLCYTDYEMVTPGGLKMGGFGTPGCLGTQGSPGKGLLARHPHS